MKISMSRDVKGIMAVFGCSVAIFWPGALTFGFPGVMAPLWQEMFSAGRGTIGNTIFFMLAAVGIFMFLVGRWQERYGTRTMIVIGTIICSFSVLLAAYASSISMIYAWAFITGIGSSFVYIPALTTVQWWYPGRKGLVTGFVSMIFGLSAAIMSPVFGKMLMTIGYTSMNIVIAILTLTIGLFGAYFARSPNKDDIEAASSGSRSQGTIRQAIEPMKSLTVNESLHTRSFWFLGITWTLAGAAGVSMTILSTAYGLSKGFGLESSILILTAFNLTNGTGRLASGFLSDLIGRNRIMSLTFFAAAAAYFILPWSNTLTACAFLAAIIGFAFGTLFSVSAPLVADCFGLKHFGAIFGLAFAAYGFVAAPLGPTLSGYILDVTGDNFFLVFLYLGLFFLASSYCIRLVVPARQN
jgi:MFS transporter, OFA family, oxalate/formate antiporter